MRLLPPVKRDSQSQPRRANDIPETDKVNYGIWASYRGRDAALEIAIARPCALALVALGYCRIGKRIMRSTGPQWVALALAALALAIITYIAMPPGVVKQATALWGGG
jgi:hypothetical protein